MVGAGRLRLGVCLLIGALVTGGCSDPSPTKPAGRSPGSRVMSPSETTTSPPDKSHSPGKRAWTEMHSVDRPHGLVTYGRGDLDGDGDQELVIVNASGRVTVGQHPGRRVSVRIPPDPSVRLQALPDLFGDGRDEILVSQSTAGCCDYRSVDSRSLVLRYQGEGLHLLHLQSGRVFVLAFSSGRGDVFYGVECLASRLRHVTVWMAGAHRLKVTSALYRLGDGTVIRVGRAIHRQAGGWLRARALTRSSCPGLRYDGWAG
jgi:hypothetical protein